jgi:hypothetical protein
VPGAGLLTQAPPRFCVASHSSPLAARCIERYGRAMLKFALWAWRVLVTGVAAVGLLYIAHHTSAWVSAGIAIGLYAGLPILAAKQEDDDHLRRQRLWSDSAASADSAPGRDSAASADPAA